MLRLQRSLPDTYRDASEDELAARIEAAKATLGERLFILGHHYQRDEVMRWADARGDLDYDAWRREVARSLTGRGGTAVFSHYVAINAVMSVLAEDDRVLVFRPDHASISALETDGEALTLVERGREASTGVL